MWHTHPWLSICIYTIWNTSIFNCLFAGISNLIFQYFYIYIILSALIYISLHLDLHFSYIFIYIFIYLHLSNLPSYLCPTLPLRLCRWMAPTAWWTTTTTSPCRQKRCSMFHMDISNERIYNHIWYIMSSIYIYIYNIDLFINDIIEHDQKYWLIVGVFSFKFTSMFVTHIFGLCNHRP